jgi:MFS transporter, OFA family, oxalate/formate antiporter
MRAPFLARLLIPRLPFYYGWVILVCVCFAGFARQGPAVAVLSIFVEPMRSDFGWSSTVFGGAVSLGGLIAAMVSPSIGRLLDRSGARMLLCWAVIGTGLALMAISLVHSALLFYVLFCYARMNWAGPFELGLYGALNNWFLARRAVAASIATVAQIGGLVVLPLIAHYAMQGGDWRTGWIAVGACVLAVGLLPAWLLLVRRPEDVGLRPEPSATVSATSPAEPKFTRAQAMRTPAFWLLAAYTVLVYPSQAGVSLYQASHMIERGIEPAIVATVISAFSFMSALASFGVGWLPRRWPIRFQLAASGALMGCGALTMLGIHSALEAFACGALFGLGIGGLLTLLPIVWADYFGRESYGAIRGTALTMQVIAQACGPIGAGALRDAHGDYTWSLALFGSLAILGAAVVLMARRPTAFTPA